MEPENESPTWQERLKGCFGVADKKFGRHAADEERGKKLKEYLDSEGITWAQVEVEVKKLLAGCTDAHTEQEIKQAKRLLCFGEERS